MKALIALAVALPLSANADQLTLEKFLKQVEEKNQSVTASKLIVEGTTSRADEGKLIFKPSLFAQAQTSSDKKLTTNVAAQGDRTDYTAVSAGIMQQFNFGLQSKLSYNLSHTKIYDATPSFLPISDFRTGVTTLELSQSLWRNFLGREARSQEEVATAAAAATKHIENYKIKTTLALAESIFWSLSQALKVVKVEKDSLDRAKKIRDWNQNRLRSGLAENADFLQADTNYKAREYELKSTLIDLKTLQRSLNALRGIDSDIVEENFEEVDSAKIKMLALPKKEELRDDTKSALEQQKIAKANAAMSIEKNKPTLELFGAYALNGKAVQTGDAVSDSFKTDHDTKAIGLRFIAPLDFGSTSDNINGYKKEQIAAEQNFQRKLFDQDQQWNDLSAKLEDAKVKLSLVEQIEQAQKIKASNERDRLNKGRTTTFQVLNFEQDYAQSELSRIQSETNILNIYSQLKTFSAGGTK